jgi:hypothetical protein
MHMQCVLLSTFLSQHFVSTKWRKCKGNFFAVSAVLQPKGPFTLATFTAISSAKMYGEEKSTKHIRYQSTHSHPSKAENRIRNRSESCKSQM